MLNSRSIIDMNDYAVLDQNASDRSPERLNDQVIRHQLSRRPVDDLLIDLILPIRQMDPSANCQ
jgi:hypothetical protein